MTENRYADIILPFAVKGRYTYSIPDEISDKVIPGMLVRVHFGKKNLYNGIVYKVHGNIPSYSPIKPILEIVYEKPLINDQQLKLWSWISEYYMCSEGEVMKASLPGELGHSTFKPRTEAYVSLTKKFSEEELIEMLNRMKKAPRQQDLLSNYIMLSGYENGKEIVKVKRSLLLSESETTLAVLGTLITKGILKTEMSVVSRLTVKENDIEPLKQLSPAQEAAYTSVRSHFHKKDIVLLHGVTSSGKTEIYIHLIEEQLRKGKQVLYMLPEIALTTQIITRLKRHFGKITGVYHSRFSDAEKAEIWKNVSGENKDECYKLILGVRSSVFLPFYDLGLIIVDEEHDSSYKQQDPAPRYHARDTAIMLASFHKARTILGSASPSVESYNNALKGKYGLTELKERYGLIKLPDIILANAREAYRKKLMVSHFTPELLHAMDEALGNKEQIILFQNRRGFSPYIECSECGWIPACIHCAVNLTYHKAMGRLVCHYCGYSTDMPTKCTQCHSSSMVTRGFGTEKIEDEIKIVFPEAMVARMDQDTTRGKNSFNKLIKAFEDRKIDILIGTQMISKGLDFENLTVVGILNADNLLNFPDFRAHERSFQLMEQVSGRAGRRQKQGKVVIQTYDPTHRIIRQVVRHDYVSMFQTQAEERQTFNYPPFCRMVKISLRHKDRTQLNHFADILGNELRQAFGKRVLGPEFPLISQIQQWFIKNILIKIERDKPPVKAKQLIQEAVTKIEQQQGASSLKIAIDVDPY
jgi:primosomal protein N' (replication factor Y) (superfamily II helicase)